MEGDRNHAGVKSEDWRRLVDRAPDATRITELLNPHGTKPVDIEFKIGGVSLLIEINGRPHRITVEKI